MILKMENPKIGKLVVIYFYEGLAPILGYLRKKMKGFIVKKEVEVWESTEGTELDEKMISSWEYFKSKD